MTMDERVKRINELYHKSKDCGLTEEEKEEQKRLRMEYVMAIRGSITSQLNNIDIKEADGSITNLGQQHAQKIKEKEKSSKEELRASMLKKRNSMSKKDVELKSSSICLKLVNSPYYDMAEEIYLYYPIGNEVAVLDIFEKALKDGKKVAFPKSELVDGIPSLDFYYVSNINEFETGYKGIPEPNTHDFSLEKVSEFKGLCIVPLLGFDETLNRIGYGKGFYDSFLKDKSINSVGVAYELQHAESVYPSENDVKLTAIITEENIYR